MLVFSTLLDGRNSRRRRGTLLSSFRTDSLLPLLFLLLLGVCSEEMHQIERFRVIEYHKRGYTWPIPQLVPNTLGWKKLYDHRFRQASEIDHRQQRYEAYAQTISSALIQPNYTTWGFGLVRAPYDLMEDLRDAVRDRLKQYTNEDGILQEHLIPTEGGSHSIEGPNPPWFIEGNDMADRVLNELQTYVETWAGLEVVPSIAYGFRFYRNQSSLGMHIDRSHTHVLSFILHIDSSDDSEPWPITIEDFNGGT